MTEMEHRHEAFESIAQPNLPLLWRCARRLVRTGHEAEDLVQETCLKALRAWHQFRPGTDARAWLVTILLNTARDQARKVQRQPETLVLDELTTLYQQYSTEQARAPAPEKAASQAEVRRLVRLALDDLSPELRMTVLLADVEEFTYQEIADIMGCPIGTVMSRLPRARHLVRTTLQAVLEDERMACERPHAQLYLSRWGTRISRDLRDGTAPPYLPGVSGGGGGPSSSPEAASRPSSGGAVSPAAREPGGDPAMVQR